MNRKLVSGLLAGVAIILGLVTGCSHNNNSSVSYLIAGEPNGLTLVAGEVRTVAPNVSANGQAVANPQLTFAVTGNIGAITAAGVLTATTSVTSSAPKTGTVEVTGYGTNVSIPVTVIAGPLAKIVISGPSGVDLANVTSGTALTFTAEGEDQYDNRSNARFAITPTWSVEGGIGTISSAGVLQAVTAGTGKVVATVGAVRGELAVTVKPGAVSQVIVCVTAGADVQHLTIGDQVQFSASGADDAGNRKRAARLALPSAPVWTVTGNLGTITSGGLFTAKALGTGKVVATCGSLSGNLDVAVTNTFTGTVVYEKTSGGSTGLCKLDGTGATSALGSLTNHFGSPSWSADGSKLVFTAQGTDYTGICVMNVATGAVSQVSAVAGQDPAFSPDGSKIAFSNGMLVAGELQVIDAGGNLVRNIATGILGNPRHPVWSPDGSKIVFAISSGLGLADGVYIINADGTNLSMIYAGYVSDIQWVGTLQKIAVATTHTIITLPTNQGQVASALEELVNDIDTLSGGFALSPNGYAVIYAVQNATGTQLRLKNLTADLTMDLTNLTGAAMAQNPTWK